MAATIGPNLGIAHSWTQGESAWNTLNDSNLKILDALLLIQVLSATTTAQPGVPTAGDRYILPVAATGTDWAGNDGAIALYDGTSWVFFTPQQGWEIRAGDSQQRYVYDSAAWKLEATLYGTYADDTAAATGLVPIGGFYLLTATNALTVRTV